LAYLIAGLIIPNHFYLLLKTGNVPIATLMRRLLTGHAICHNRRYLLAAKGVRIAEVVTVVSQLFSMKA